MTTERSSKALKVTKGTVSFFFHVLQKTWNVSFFPPSASPSLDQAGMWWEHAGSVRQWAHVPVSTRAEPPPARPVSRRNTETEAAPAHAEESGLRRQLPGQTGVPARSPGEAENGASEGGGEARGGECWHEKRAGGPRRAPRCAPEVCQRFRSRRGPPAGYSAAP